MLSITTDYIDGQGPPEPRLRAIAEAGFTHIHWCHQWDTDFLYGPAECRAIAGWLKDYGLQLLDLHASFGREKCWVSPLEYEREAGVESVTNRIYMTAQLGGDVIVMHTGAEAAQPTERACAWEQLRRSLDDLEPVSSAQGVRIALENGRFDTIRRLLDEYPPSYLGLCYDTGHGNLDGDGLDQLDALKSRLIAVHTHDNDGASDQHRIPFTGTVDWPRFCRILAHSAYDRPISQEVSTRAEPPSSEAEFLARTYDAGRRLSAMVAAAR